MPAFALLLPTAAATLAFKDASFSAADSGLPTRLEASCRGARMGDALPRSMAYNDIDFGLVAIAERYLFGGHWAIAQLGLCCD